jgi:hypothetical protein
VKAYNVVSTALTGKPLVPSPMMVGPPDAAERGSKGCRSDIAETC